MAVMAREAWTDERLDDLKENVDKRFDRVDEGLGEVKGEIRHLRAEMNSRFEAVDARFDSMQRTIIVCFASMTTSIVGALLVTQL
jgi:hypothetical protein